MIVANSLDLDGRGPTDQRLALVGVVLLLAVTAVVSVLLLKSRGKFDDAVRVDVELVNVGDGLPAQSDVKFRGVLVGWVTDVVAARAGHTNIVHTKLKRNLAMGIPSSVTARVVPSNVFAVSSVQLIDHGGSAMPLQPGDVIAEDRSLPTLLFQSTLSKFRQVFKTIGREPSSDRVGLLTALGEATTGRGDQLLDASRDLNRIIQQLNTVVGEGDQSTVSALTEAVRGLREVSPDLFDTLESAVRPMLTLSEKRGALDDFLSAGLNTFGTMGQAFDNHTDQLINVTTQFTPVLGVFGDNASQLHPIFSRLQRLGDNFYDEAWNADTNLFAIKAIVSLTPTRTYGRGDCPRYGEMAGPSCQTAPEVPVAPALLPALASRGFYPSQVPENRPNLAPPRNSVQSPQALAPDHAPPAPALPRQEPASGPVQPAAYGGTVGAVGSQTEKTQLNRIVGTTATPATQLLLGPLARGTTVHITVDTEHAR